MPLFGGFKPDRVKVETSHPEEPIQDQERTDADDDSASFQTLRRRRRRITASIPFWKLFRELPPDPPPAPPRPKPVRPVTPPPSAYQSGTFKAGDCDVVTTFRITTTNADTSDSNRNVSIENEGLCKSIRINKKKNLVFHISLNVVDGDEAAGDVGKKPKK